MKFQELDTVVLDRDLPEHGLRKGDLGAIVMTYGQLATENVETLTRGDRSLLIVPAAAA